MIDPTPLMPWTSSELDDGDGAVVWWTRFDGRYQVEVREDSEFDNQGHLYIWDRKPGGASAVGEECSLVHRAQVALAAGARFGPDVADIVSWKRIAMRYADRVVADG